MRGLVMAAMLLTVGPLAADGPYGDISDLKVANPKDKEDSPSVPAPSGAVILFDGKNLDGWIGRDGKSPVKWNVVEKLKAMEVVKSGDIITKDKFEGPFKLHVEFRVPYEPKNKGQGRGNSGVYVQGRWEIQVLDSYGIEKPGIGDCGALYSIAVPKVNACKAPTVWQTYDIEYTPPECKDGKKVKNGRMTVVHNGIKIHDNQEITRDVTTSGLPSDVCKPGPLLLQDHGHPVQYRNIWLLKTESK